MAAKQRRKSKSESKPSPKPKPFRGHRWKPQEFSRVIKLMHAERDKGAAYGKAATTVAAKMGMTQGQIACAYDIGLRKQTWQKGGDAR